MIAFRLLRAAGLDPDKDIRKQSLSVNASVDAIKDGKIDAFFWSGGVPTAAVLGLLHSPGLTANILPLDDVLLECLGETVWQAQRTGAAPGEAAYLDCIRRGLG